MRQYEGAVFFVDMLGVGALTENKVALIESDFRDWNVQSSLSPTANLFCGHLLAEFRSCLALIGKSHKQVKIAQLSDCAYIWSESVDSVLDAVREFMWKSVTAGLLSRGGMAYGEIVEPEKINRSIGQFILGGAVTRAVGLEKSGKGCRVFVDNAIVERFADGSSVNFKNQDILLLKNPLDGSVVNEFCWYRTGGSTGGWQVEQHTAAKMIISLLTRLQYCPRFNWNEASQHGRIQLACSIDSVSSATPDFIGNGNYIVSSEQYFSSLPAKSSRTTPTLERVLCERVDDIARFFVDGRQKDAFQRWRESSLSS